MSSCDEWMPLYVGRYLGDTGHLTYDQHGPYLLLLMHYWRKGPLPDDDTMLAAIARVPLDVWMTRMGRILRDFFEVQEDGLLHQKRADAERAKRAGVSADRAAAGRAGARKRWQQDDNVVTARAVVTGEAQEPSPMPDGKPIANAIASAIDLPKQTDSMVQVQVPKEERVHKASLYGAEAPASKAVQTSLLPEPDRQPAHKPEKPDDPKTAKAADHPRWSEGLELLALVSGESLAKNYVGVLKNMYRLARSVEGNVDLVLTALDQVMSEGIDSYNMGRLTIVLRENSRQGRRRSSKTELTVVHDADDHFGIQAWCKKLTGVKPTSSAAEKANGKWIAYGWIIDSVAASVAEAAELPTTWRGKWDLLAEWLKAGFDPDDIAKSVQRAVEVIGRKGEYSPPAKDLKLFDGWVKTARKVA